MDFRQDHAYTVTNATRVSSIERVITMTAYTPPAPHRDALPTRTRGRTRLIPHLKNRVGALAAVAGLSLALVSLYLPWLTTRTGTSLSGLGITEIVDVRSVARSPVCRASTYVEMAVWT